MSTDEVKRLRCEKVVNETWSKANKYLKELKVITLRGKINNKREEAILLVAANAAVQKMIMDNTEEPELFGDIVLTPAIK